jgi:hypothetical protein
MRAPQAEASALSSLGGARPGQPGTRPGMTNNQWWPASAVNSAARQSR